MERLIIVGTSHISPESKAEVRRVILKERPDIVAVELDKKRLLSLTQQPQGQAKSQGLALIRRVGVQGFIFALIGSWVMQYLSKKIGTQPGDDMLAAIQTASEIKARVALIDQDIDITLKKFSKQITWKERLRIVGDVISAPFQRNHPLKIDINKVPSKILIKKLLKMVKKRYPNIYDVLVHQRNVIMAKRLAKLLEQDRERKIVAVIGAGHEEDMEELVQKYLSKASV